MAFWQIDSCQPRNFYNKLAFNVFSGTHILTPLTTKGALTIAIE